MARKRACLESVFWREDSRTAEFGDWAIELLFPSRTVEWPNLPLDRATALKVRAAPTSLSTLFPSSTGSRLSPSSSHGAIHVMAQTDRSNVRYVDPQRRYTLVLGPSWNAPIGALPHDDRAGTHDSADGQCGSYASIRHGQAATNVFRHYPQGGCRNAAQAVASSRHCVKRLPLRPGAKSAHYARYLRAVAGGCWRDD
jgi:hypothetical protein